METLSITNFDQLPTGVTLGFNIVLKELAALKVTLASLSGNDRNVEDTVYRTRKETAALLKISIPTLSEYTKTGVINASRLGRRVLYTEQDIQQALKKIKTKTGK